MPRALPDISITELTAVVRAVRAQPRWDRYLRASGLRAEALFAALVAIFLHSAMSPAWISSQARFQAHEENQMLSLRQVAVVSSIALSSSALAQNAVQWRVQDGGNGHWYAIRMSGESFAAAKESAEALGGYLATITSSGEQSFVASLAAGTDFLNAWIGLSQAPGSSEPSAGWQWVTGEAFGLYTNWWSGVPQPDNRACGSAIAEDFGVWAKQWDGAWADVTAEFIAGAPCTGVQSHAIIEWSADCNSDGIVDYGQIRSGELADTNGNNVPDCCEAASKCPDLLPPREWPLAAGGNGHWYQLRVDPLQTFSDFNAKCVLRGGHMATITTAAEHGFVIALMQEQNWLGLIGWPAIGLSRESGTAAWAWVTAEVVSYQPWAVGEPSDAGRFAQLWGIGSNPNLTWSANGNAFVSAAVIEWSSDCNNDGIVDFGQIRSGILADANANNIPDCCESAVDCDPCHGDVDGSGAVNGVDLAAILNSWGTNGGKYPGADTNDDGIVDGTDLAEVLNGWGTCP